MALAYRETAKTHGDALRREFAIKKLTRAAKDALIAKRKRSKRA